jgi:hypothetical protein
MNNVTELPVNARLAVLKAGLDPDVSTVSIFYYNKIVRISHI